MIRLLTMENNIFEISMLRHSYIKNEKIDISNFLIKENNITKLFLIRLLIYSDYCNGLWETDNVKINKINDIVSLSKIRDTLSYKIMLSQEIKSAMQMNCLLPTQYQYESYISATLLSASEKLKIYSTLDDHLFCYYLWAHTIKEPNYFFANLDEARLVREINRQVFKNKMAMFHEQRKLIVILGLELNHYNPIDIGLVKTEWSKICKCDQIIELDEKNPKFVEWALQYTIKFIEINCINNDDDNKINPVFYDQMVTVKDKIETCYTLINFYIFKKADCFSIFKKKINLAITQQERRDRTKKNLSAIKLSKAHEKKLKELSEHQKTPKKQLLEKMIDHYYDNVKG